MLYQARGIRDSSSTYLVCRGSEGAMGLSCYESGRDRRPAGSGREPSVGRGRGARRRGGRTASVPVAAADVVVRFVVGSLVMLLLLLMASVAMVVGRWLGRFRMSWMLRRRL